MNDVIDERGREGEGEEEEEEEEEEDDSNSMEGSTTEGTHVLTLT